MDKQICERIKFLEKEIVELKEKCCGDSKQQEMEEFLLTFLDGATIKLKPEYPESIFYKKDGEVFAEYDEKNALFWTSYAKIWSVFYDKYGLNHDEIQTFIKGMAEKHYKLRGITPFVVAADVLDRWRSITNGENSRSRFMNKKKT